METTILFPNLATKFLKRIDWVKKGAVTDVEKIKKSVVHVGVLARTGTLEGQLFKKTGNLISLSEQNLVDCTPGALVVMGVTWIKLWNT
ncbi:hypothetical protein NQ317_007469 [Molorchus minor]|uniref:Peptidase C1A papain C-terminal domain-containing protein n=1 Tax=Molorchus minor TaxID=1323400 RepID=A0ABQ9K2B4_9CUCU|nr:hypothetical protein NQ317_007469 [Molorchus minor]